PSGSGSPGGVEQWRPSPRCPALPRHPVSPACCPPVEYGQETGLGPPPGPLFLFSRPRSPTPRSRSLISVSFPAPALHSTREALLRFRSGASTSLRARASRRSADSAALSRRLRPIALLPRPGRPVLGPRGVPLSPRSRPPYPLPGGLHVGLHGREVGSQVAGE